MRTVAICCTLLAGAFLFARAIDAHYAIRDWLLVRYAQAALLSAWTATGALAIGYRAIARLGGTAIRFSERLLLAFACGVLIFGLGVFAAGVAGGFGPMFFFAWPSVLVLAGGRVLAREVVPSVLRMACWPRARLNASSRLSELVRAAFLGIGLLAVYLQVLTPGNVSFDARWYHLTIAEHYAVEDAIRPFREGWYLGAYPQLASWLYAWAFQLPGDLFDRVALCAHLEWTLFLATVPGVGLLARRVARGAWARWSGAALFLFPSLLIYDSNLNAGADHVLAFWAIPLALSVAIARRSLLGRSALLVGAMAAAAMLTKYQAVYLTVPACLVALAVVLRARRLRLLWPALAAIVVLTAPHWLKNTLFYGDPLYPLLHGTLPSEPFHAGAEHAMHDAYFPRRFLLSGTWTERLREALPVLATFSFEPHNWRGHGIPQPTFGSLFTVFSAALPFLTQARRLWLLSACTHLGILIWFCTNHQDRFLQALLPWMAAYLSAAIARIWSLGLVARGAVSVAIAVQVAWGADAFFYTNHRMLPAAPITQLAELVASGPSRSARAPVAYWGDAEKLGALLPAAAVVLVHDAFLRLGIGRLVVTDQKGFQGTFGYRDLHNAREVWSAWRALGITHVMWQRPRSQSADAETLAREASFYEAALRATRAWKTAHGYTLAELRADPPPDTRRVLRVAGCGRDPKSGTFEIRLFRPRSAVLRALTSSDASAAPTVVALRESCTPKREAPALRRDGFRKMASLGGLDLWVRAE